MTAHFVPPLHAGDEDWLVQYARWLGRSSRERHEKRIAMRRAWLDDTQADRDWNKDQREWCEQ